MVMKFRLDGACSNIHIKCHHLVHIMHSELSEHLAKSLETLKKELKGSTDLQARQEDLISTLKEETGIMSEMELEMKEIRRKYRELQQMNDEQNELISRLRRVRR